MNRTCFVIMPFAPRFDGIWNIVIRKAISNSGDTCHRADDIFAPGVIINDVLAAIAQCDYIVADLSVPNPNVYYELGFCHCLKKPAILITQDLASIPFDLRHQRLITYQDTASGADALRESIESYVSQL